MLQKEFLLKNKNGLSVTVLSTGAAISEIVVPDADGNFQNVALGFQDKKDYMDNPLFAGAALGPVAGRISGAKLSISGKTYHLTKNDGQNNLHGGTHNISFAQWEGGLVDEHRLELHTFLAGGTDGFPGNRHFYARYSLEEDNRLTLVYTAVSDQDTYFNLSNHTYLNLTGDFAGDALTQELAIRAGRYIKNDACHIPTALAGVEASPFDFRTPASPGSYMNAYSEVQPYGYNNGFFLDAEASWESSPAAVLQDTKSGRRVKIFTDAPCLFFYSGGYMPNNMLLHSHVLSSPGCAIALEAQDFPDALNCPFLEGAITKKESIYKRTIQYHFDTIHQKDGK